MKSAPINPYQLIKDHGEQWQALLPETVQTMAQVIGLDKAMLVVENLAGTELLMPKKTTCRSARRLAALIGPEAMQKLTEYFGGDCLYIPTCASLRRRLLQQAFFHTVLKDMEQGTSQHQATRTAALSFGISERTGRSILKAMSQKAPDGFDDLF